MTHEPLNALLVDVGGTLVDDATWLEQDRYEAHMVARLRDAFGTEHPWFAPLASHRFVESDAPTWQQRTGEVVTAMLAEHGYQASAEEVERICRACAAPLSQVVELSDGALEVVQAIRNLGVRMVICSNTLWRNDADSRRDWEELGFGEYFDGYVTSHDTGFGKPHPAMFERALAAVDARPSQAAIMGDRPERDLAGARAVGMRSIWMRPPDFVGEPELTPDAVVNGWSEVPPILAAWVAGTLPGDAADDRSKTAAAAIFDHAGRVLLIREGYGRRRYGLPGGALKVGESPQDAVLRETAEETSLRVQILRTVGRYMFTGAAEFTSFVYHCEVVDGAPTLPDTGEVAEIGWFDPNALPAPLTHLAPVAIPDAVGGRSNVERTIRLAGDGS